MLELNPKLYYLKKFSIRMVRADPDPDVHDQLRVHGDAAGAVLDHAGGALRGVPGPGELVIVLATNLREVYTITENVPTRIC